VVSGRAVDAKAAPTSQSQRSVVDGSALLGIGTTRELDRFAAAVGLLDGTPLRFESADDIPNGGVLCALPAMLAIGLLRHTGTHFAWPKGYYPMEPIFIILACLALARVQSLEQVRYQSPGEWGKLMGLDRIPEVRTLRHKLALLADDTGRTARWATALARDWMAHDVQAAGVLLIDGHTRVYHGSLTKLPRRYITRERLCLRATTDYWVNALDGAPFFCVTQPIDPGLQKTLEADIIPRLLADVPQQPTQSQLDADPLRHRFTLVFDREGYSPDLFARLENDHRIAILTYHKHPGADWPQSEFCEEEVTLVNGEQIRLTLAERGTRLSNGHWLREIRKRDPKSGHQTAILSTDYVSEKGRLAAAMFARWHQENFFKYMRQHYGLDRLVEQGTSPLPDTTRIVNPTWRALESQVRSTTSKLSRAQAIFAAQSLISTAHHSPQAAARHEQKQGAALEQIQQLQAQLSELKAQRKAQPKHIELKELPEGQRIEQLRSGRKHFMDTIKLIAYRAESTLVQLVRESLTRSDDARSLVAGLMQTSINLRPDVAGKALVVEIHGQANTAQDRVIEKLCEELNATETVYPGTNLVLKYKTLRSSLFPRDQDV
jgi:hypothetical protein